MPTDVQTHLPLRPVEFEILVTLGTGPRHGYAILQDAEERDGVTVGVTTLYRALQRMHESGLIEPVARPDPDARKEVYGLTQLGRAVARAEARRLQGLLGVAREGVLGPGGS